MKKFIIPVVLFSLFSCQNNPSQVDPSKSPSPSASASSSPVSSATPSVSATPISSASPVPSASASPAEKAYSSNVRLFKGNNNEIIVCADGTACPVPNSPTEVTPVKISSPKFIDESKYESVKNRFSLFAVNKAKDYLGGLSPSYALAEGLKASCEENEGLAFNGGKLRSCSSLVIEKTTNNFENINSVDSLKKNFAPVDSAQEAISYVAAATNTEPLLELSSLKPSFRYYQLTIKPTTAVVDGTGYKVNMFTYDKFGCGPHPHYEVTYSVSKDGDIKQLSKTHIYDDPMQDGLCID